MPPSADRTTPWTHQISRALGRLLLRGVIAFRTWRLERAGIRKQSVSLGDDHVAWWEGGEGPPLVLLQGFGASALWQWYPLLLELVSHRRVIAPDLLWFGDSSSTNPEHSLHHQARAVAALIDHLGLSNVDLVGLSYGGMVSHELMGQRPDLVDRLILIASPARAFLADDKKELLEELGLRDTSELALPRTPDELRRLMGFAFTRPPWITDGLGRAIIDKFYAPRRDHHLALLNAVGPNTLAHRDSYPIPDRPTLVVWGEEDRVFPEFAAHRLREEIGPSSWLCIFENAAHAPHLERTRPIADAMLSFLSGERPSCGAGARLLEPTVA